MPFSSFQKVFDSHFDALRWRQRLGGIAALFFVALLICE